MENIKDIRQKMYTHQRLFDNECIISIEAQIWQLSSRQIAIRSTYFNHWTSIWSGTYLMKDSQAEDFDLSTWIRKKRAVDTAFWRWLNIDSPTGDVDPQPGEKRGVGADVAYLDVHCRGRLRQPRLHGQRKSTEFASEGPHRSKGIPDSTGYRRSGESS